MRVYVATKNPGKLREMEQLFAGSPLELTTYPEYRDPVEGDASYAHNAALKARALREQLLAAGIRAAVLADDSGLEVAALGGRPGVMTAYYGGDGLTWAERRRALLEEMERLGARDRRARFVCALHFIDAEGRETAGFGLVDGEIAPEERGEVGFSFDPIFLYPPAGRTFAELSAEAKNRVSHRAYAARRLLSAMQNGPVA